MNMEHKKGVEIMRSLYDEIYEETKEKVRVEIATNMINDGTLSFEEIAECCDLSLEKVKELAGNKPA